MVKFRCKRSGNFVAFSSEDDIRHMRTHEGYEEVGNEAHADEAVKVTQAAEAQEVLKPKRGRPRKEEVMEI